MTLRVLNDRESTRKSINYAIIDSLKCEAIDELVNARLASFDKKRSRARKHAHSGFSSLVQSLLPKDTLLRTYLTSLQLVTGTMWRR